MAHRAKEPRTAWKIEGLGADGPNPELKEKMMLFGQFIGDWDISEDRFPRPNGTVVKQRGEVHFGWILDGRAIQDVWAFYKKDPHRVIHAGTTIRFYDAGIDAWRSTWIAPDQGVVRTFIGRKIKDEIVLESTAKEGYPEHWIFSEITPTSFRWRAEETHDNGKTWQLTEDMKIRRNRTSSLHYRSTQ
jgi:hypothetical protein